MSSLEPTEDRETEKPKKKGKMAVADVQKLVMDSKMSGMAGIAASKLQEDRTDAMDYYLGDMSKDMPAQEGRSQAVSTDVFDAIEGLMPNLMDIFAGSDEVVCFEPVGPDDEDMARQETDYINHIFMQQNNGFMVLYTMIKDAMLSKIGIVKVWWDITEREERETYYNLTQDEFFILLQAVQKSEGAMKIVAHSERPEGSEQDVDDEGTS